MNKWEYTTAWGQATFQGGNVSTYGSCGSSGLGPACIVAVRWIRGAASNAEKASMNNYQNKLRLIPSSLLFFLL
jgi:hypothetical protein